MKDREFKAGPFGEPDEDRGRDGRRDAFVIQTELQARSSRATRYILILVALAAMPTTVFSQAPEPLAPEPLDVMGKLSFHAKNVYSPTALAGVALYAGLLQADNIPREWGQDAGAYGKRFGSTVAWSVTYNTIAFGLDTTLHQDPRYFRLGGSGFWRRSGHALRGTLMTRKDSGGETLSTWRLGSAYGAAFISNEWYPDRLNTVRLGFIEGTVTVGLGFASNMGSEFWPDIRKKVFHKR